MKKKLTDEKINFLFILNVFNTTKRKRKKKLLVTNTGWTHKKIYFFVLNVFNTAKKQTLVTNTGVDTKKYFVLF